MTKALIVATYALAAIALGAAIGLFAGMPTGTLAGCVVFLLLAASSTAASRAAATSAPRLASSPP